jgi:hypothetical protein
MCINMENFRLITRLTRRVPPVEQDLLTIPEYLSSPPVRVTRSVSTFSFGYCVVCSSLIYGFWLPLWYLQTTIIKHCLQNPTSVHSGKWLKQKMIPWMLLYFKLIIWIHMRNVQSNPKHTITNLCRWYTNISSNSWWSTAGKSVLITSSEYCIASVHTAHHTFLLSSLVGWDLPVQ